MTGTIAAAPLRPAAASELDLPPGRWHGELWLTDRPLDRPRSFLAGVAAQPRTALWPLLVPPECNVGELFAARAPSRIDRDPGAVLARWWAGAGERRHGLGTFSAFPAFPGLARPAWIRADPLAEAGNTGSLLAARAPHRLGLVRASRPADVPALLGWCPPSAGEEGPAGVSAVLRSWEDRFGAVLISLGPRAVELSVAAPPRTPDRALAVAAEHLAFCPEPDHPSRDEPWAFANELVGRRRWRFRWAPGGV
ncbi:protein of unknown function [Amycolatopsis arida]|uniref:DUF4253 domain-containing protein n=1 Tax=Amycolatopsis arida TaxID=587909 RepID=A0A1I5QRC4_9PSEU|nr:DUF4253 domain-containing protein [Amycolatopsis arida]TDX98929.1 uncharacterized protein DUF4253 [Amycolatopsis arida]SFP48607.1 protein of unknown function [Amycolatopsis arida]